MNMEAKYCCCCAKDLIRYHVYGIKVNVDMSDGRVLNCIAYVCDECKNKSEEPHGKAVVELLISTRVNRLENPERKFKPEE